jgi:hypothetical protein
MIYLTPQLLPAWLSLGVAIVVAFIGFLQWRTAREQCRTANNRAVFDLFQRRYEVYQEFRYIVGVLTGSVPKDSKVWMKAAEAVEKAKFLFGDDVVAYLDQFRDDIRDLENCVKEIENLQGSDQQKNLEKQCRLRNSIEEFRTKGPTLFARYIRFDHKII